MSWRSIASRRAGERRNSEAAQELVAAYREVFSGSEQAEMVLADLADYCGFYVVPPLEATDSELRDDRAKRDVFSRIYQFLTLSSERMEALERAAKAEAIANEEEGIL